VATIEIQRTVVTAAGAEMRVESLLSDNGRLQPERSVQISLTRSPGRHRSSCSGFLRRADNPHSEPPIRRRRRFVIGRTESACGYRLRFGFRLEKRGVPGFFGAYGKKTEPGRLAG
jgi:hypothetical protein